MGRNIKFSVIFAVMRIRFVKEFIMSFKIMRKVVGWLAILMGPGVVLLGFFQSPTLPVTISDTYWSCPCVFMVGVLISCGGFLLCDREYKSDIVFYIIMGICAIGVALFPDAFKPHTRTGIFNMSSDITQYFHFVFAGGLFFLLGYVSMFLFTKSNRQVVITTVQKLVRNKVYIICGIIIWSAMILFALSNLIPMPRISGLILETIMLVAFGIAWLVKGNGVSFLNDRK
jgi:hypothetical protein